MHLPLFSAKGDDYELFCGMTEYTSMYIETECKISYEQSQIVYEELREFSMKCTKHWICVVLFMNIYTVYIYEYILPEKIFKQHILSQHSIYKF